MFDQFFDVVLADTAEGIQENFRLRYKVYCEEMGYESTDQFPDKQECDEWDDSSVHFLIRHRASGEWVGAMRLVPEQNSELPFNSFMDDPIKLMQGNRSVEVSRLCLVKEIRRRKDDGKPPLGLKNTALSQDVYELYDRRQIEKSLIWGLIRAGSQYCEESNISNWYFLCARALARMIQRENFALKQIGQGCEHNGKRYPYAIEVSDVLANSLWENDFKNNYLLFSELSQHEIELPLAA
jgi:N-acyl amino acid synthase of PEP-CTERM/exosortase system